MMLHVLGLGWNWGRAEGLGVSWQRISISLSWCVSRLGNTDLYFFSVT